MLKKQHKWTIDDLADESSYISNRALCSNNLQQSCKSIPLSVSGGNMCGKMIRRIKMYPLYCKL